MAVIPHPLRWYPPLHLVAYQAVWVIALMGGAAGTWWPGVVAGALTLVVHIVLQPRRDLACLRLLGALAIGLIADGALLACGVLSFSAWSSPVPPAWMLVLWPSFASLFDDLLAWLVRRPLLGAVLGALGGPLAYYGGHALGAVAFPAGLTPGLAAIALAWALATPALLTLWRWRAGGG